MTGVLNEMRQTNRLITKEAVFLYCEQKTRSAFSFLLSLSSSPSWVENWCRLHILNARGSILFMLVFLAKLEVS